MTTKKINLALQGGGAHGAYTWGVLDRLLEEENIIIEGISGTSAGAMNGAMLINGYVKGGRQGAKECLETFWSRISDVGIFSPLKKFPLESLASGWLDFVTRTYSPYVLNPFNINPLRHILDDILDFKALHHAKAIKLFVTATHVASGQARIFQCREITADTLLASSCIPFLFQAIEIDGEHYWDGGYMGNPAIWPLIYRCKSEDVVLVQINPIHEENLPRKADEIISRLNEITFNSSLIAEMRAIEFVSRLLKKKLLNSRHYKDMRVHLIYSPDHMHQMNASSKINVDWDFFLFLKEVGRQDAGQWLKRNWKHVGARSTVNIREKFLCGPGHKRPPQASKKHADKYK